MKRKLILLLGLLSISMNAQKTELETNSFSLQEAIDFAILNAYDILDAQNNVQAAEQKVRETKSIGLPQINGGIDYQNYLKQQVSLIPAEFSGGNPGDFNEIIFGTKQNIGVGAQLNQLLFDGSYLIGLKGIKVYLDGIEKSKIKTEFVVKQVVANAYTYVLLVEENSKILEDNKAILEKNLRETGKLVETGFAEEQNAEQIELNLATIENDIKNTNKILASAYKLLNIAMGIDTSLQIVLTEDLESLLVKNMDLSLISQEFDITNHIDYQLSLTEKEYQELTVKFEKSKNYPTLNAFVNYNTTAFSDEFTFTDTTQKWYGSSLLGVSLSVPIFSSFQRSSRTQQAKIELDKADRNLSRTAQDLSVELLDAQNDYQYAIESYNIAKNSLDLAERIEHKTNVKYTEGISSSFDLSNAQQQLYDGQKIYLESILYLINSKVTLENILNIK